MPIQGDPFGKFSAYLRAVEDEARSGSRALNSFRGDAKKIAEDGLKQGMVEGIGPAGARYTTAELKPRTLETRPGDGPPRAPRRESSRMTQGIVAEWTSEGGTMVLTAAVRGVEFARYLLRRWPAGLHPDALSRLHQRFAQVPDNIRKSGGGR